MLILTLLACSNVNEHAWGGGGTHYSTGELYEPPTDSGSDSGDTAGTDTADTATAATLFPVGTPTCEFTDAPNIGIVILCTSEWSETDAALITDGTLYYNLMDADHLSLINEPLDIVVLADNTTAAYIDGTEVTFSLSGLDEDKSYFVAFYVESADGTAHSEETEYTVSPYSG